MKEIITLNGKKYVEYIEPEKEYKRWRAAKWWIYYTIYADWDVNCDYDDNDNMDESKYNIGNYFQTEEEAIKERDKLLAIVRVNDKILELNEWWKPDFEKYYNKYTIYYDNNEYTFIVQSYCYNSGSFAIYYMKSEEIAEQIIKEHQEDLKLIFDI